MTNEGYAVAKIAGLKLCQACRQEYGSDFIVAVPANLYGLGDNFDPDTGLVVDALISRLHLANIKNAKVVEVWGSGKSTRDFFYIDDCVDSLLYLQEIHSDGRPVNIGTGLEISIRDLVEAVANTAGFEGELIFDLSKPDSMPRKVFDVSKATKPGWSSKTKLVDGLSATYQWYLENIAGSVAGAA
jgi:GDP-L-fucose synthase